MKTKTFLLSILGLAAMVSLTSCQTTSGGGPTEAVTCAKCQMVAFERVGNVNKQVTVLRGATMSCPDCESTARDYFSKGVSLKHTCSSCGGSLTHCRAH
jgi:hypothetical protein